MPRPTTLTKARVPLTRDRIVDATLHIMDTEGLDAVSMRRVAREVGVEAMSLYNHVRDKDDLLNGVIERVMGGFAFPDRDQHDDWVVYGRRLAYAWRDVLRAHPPVMQLFAERKHGTSLDTLRPMEAALEVLRGAGLGEREAVQAFHTIGGFIFGYVMMESGYLPGGQQNAQMFPPVPPDELPNVAACLPYLADCDFDGEFAFGLDLMLEGLRAKIGAG
jgi:TetR/AcrR family tetracycline transcriptional repressor